MVLFLHQIRLKGKHFLEVYTQLYGGIFDQKNTTFISKLVKHILD